MGCGDGNVLRYLARACPDGVVVGMDLYGEGLGFARRRTDCPLVRGDVRRAPFGYGFQLIGIFDVLEHIPDDCGILDDLWNLLDDGGALLLTVPAHEYLWSYFDQVSGHCRRYSAAELSKKLMQSGFEIEFLSPYMACIYPLLWLSRRLKKTTVGSADESHRLLREEVRVVPLVNPILSWLLLLESRWLGDRRRLPFGASLVALARKKTV
jgi:SAM-dependent methyltransferase